VSGVKVGKHGYECTEHVENAPNPECFYNKKQKLIENDWLSFIEIKTNMIFNAQVSL